MRKVQIIVGGVAFLLFLTLAWQIASCELANLELKDELKDVAAMGGSRIGLLAKSSDDELRDAVVRRAAEHGIRLGTDQVFVERSGTEDHPQVFLATRYQSRVTMPGFSIIFHFTATSA